MFNFIDRLHFYFL